MKRYCLSSLVSGLLVFLSPLAFATVFPNSSTRFDFDTEGDSEGWSATHSLSPLVASGGTISTSVIGSDPYLVGPPVSFEAADYPILAFRMKSDSGDTDAEIFFATASKPSFDGIKRIPIKVISDGEWHTYFIDMGIHPDWNGTVVRYRLDPTIVSTSASVEIDYFVSLSREFHTLFEFGVDGDAEGWLPIRGLGSFSVDNGILAMSEVGSDPYMHSPSLEIDASQVGALATRMALTAGSDGQFFWITAQDTVWDETKSERFSLVPDGAFHDYVVEVEGNPAWKGTITQIRLDPNNEGFSPNVQIDRIACLLPDTLLEVKSFASRRAVLRTDTPFDLVALIQNTGDSTVSEATLTLAVPSGFSVENGSTVTVLHNLVPGATAEVSWTVRTPASSGFGTFSLSVDKGGGAVPSVYSRTLFVSNPPPSPASIPRSTRTEAFFDPSENLVLQSSRVRVVAVSNEEGYSPIYLYGWSENSLAWSLGGVLAPVGDLTVLGSLPPSFETEIVPEVGNILVSSPEASGIVFSSTRLGGTLGFDLGYRLEMRVPEDVAGVDVTAELSTGAPLNLERFGALSLKAGEGAFGSDQKQALFPGVEWLVAGETSSSTLDIAAPNNIRFAPDPRWVTVPGMGILSDEDFLVGVVWEATQEWGDGKIMPSALFASPNFIDRQDNHRLDLFLPSIPDYIAPNSLTASTPFPMNSGDRVQLSARLIVDTAASDVLRLIDSWVSYHNGYPDPSPSPRSFEEEVAVSREAFLTTLWGDADKCWKHATGSFPCQDSPAFAYLLWLDWTRTGNQQARDRALEAAADYLANDPPGTMINQTGTHIRGWQAPFVFGDFANSMSALIGVGQGFLNQQRPDGSFPPFIADSSLGDPNRRELGASAEETFILLELGRSLKRTDFLEGGRLGLEHLETFVVPRAAQTFEVPQHSPDLLAAGHAVRAFVAGYEAFGDPVYLESAVYWARAGLPFLWHWNAPDRPTMRFGSVPVFGATFFVGAWFGKAVQWNGLVYAHALSRLARYDSSYPWERIAAGITVSGMIQQEVGGSLAGTYPDAWNMVGNNPQPVYINPENLLKNFYLMAGIDPDMQVVQVGSLDASDTGAVIVNTVAESLEVLAYQPGQTLKLRVKNPVGETSRLLVSGWVLPQGGGVFKNDQPLSLVPDLETVEEGWLLSFPYHLIRIRHDRQTEELTLGKLAVEVSNWRAY